jgi:hypothetical protein
VQEVSPRAWQTPDPSRIRYVYVAGHRIDAGSAVVAYEPRGFPEPRLVLTSDGVIKALRDIDLRAALGGPGQ